MAVVLTLDLQPDVVIMDVAMPGIGGMEATRRILAINPRTKVLALSMHSDRRFVREMLRAGAASYLVKESACGLSVRCFQNVDGDLAWWRRSASRQHTKSMGTISE